MMDPMQPHPPEEEEEQDLEPILVPNGDYYGTKFLREGINYLFPNYMCIISNKKNKVTFHLFVEDVLPNSSKMVVDDDERSVCSKFSVIKLNPHEAIHYAFMVKLPVWSLEKADLTVTPTKVILQILFEPQVEGMKWYLCGLIDSQLKKKLVESYEIKVCDTSLEEDPSPANSEGEDEEEWPTSDL